MHASQESAGVVDGQRRLHAGKPFVGGRKYIERAAELIGLRHILGIVDDSE